MASNNPLNLDERKLVTVLFADISGFTAMSEKLDPELVRDRINTCFSRLVPIIKKHSGTIEKFIGDEIMAIFGAPIIHEDDAEQAALSALEMMEALKRYNREFGMELRMHIGINSGAVIAGNIGSPDEYQYGVLGDTVNLASRLADAAEADQIFLGEHTSRLIASKFNLTTLEPIRVKGKSNLVTVFMLQSIKDKPVRMRGLEGYGLLSPVVGREKEIYLIQEKVAQLFTGKGGIVGIIGEAGLGKTRLLGDTLKSIQPKSWNGKILSPLILEGTTLSFGQTISFWPFQEIFRQFAGITEQDSGSVAWGKLESRLNALSLDNLEDSLPFLATLLALEVPGEWGKRIQYLDPDALGKQVFLAVRVLFTKITAETPLILIFEDLHWMDETSTRLLEFILPLVENHPILMIGLSRPYRNTPAAQLQAIIGQKFASYYHEIRLSPLPPTESDRLVRNLLDVKEIPLRLKENIIRKAEGNPFYLEEVIRTLIDAKVVSRDSPKGTWKILEDVGQLTIPDTLQGVIMARIDRLDEDMKHVIRLASVIGRNFLYTVLKAIETQALQLDALLSELQQVELIMIKQQAPELEYIFKHALAQEATYESILIQQRRELHDRVGKVIEELFSDRLEEFYGLLAYHYARAENWEKAQVYLMKAGDEAGRLAADSEALAFYKQANEVYQRTFGDRWDPVQQASLERKIGEALWRRGDHTSALEHLELGLSFLGQKIPASSTLLRLEIIKAALRQVLHRLLPGFFLAKQNRQPSQEDIEACLIYEAIGWVEAWGDPERFLLSALRELNIAEKSGFHLGIVLSSTGLGMIAIYIPIYSLASRYLNIASRWAEKVDRPIAAGMIHYGLMINEICHGNFELAAHHGENTVSSYQKAGDLHYVFLAKVGLAMVAFYQGNFDKAHSISTELVEQSKEVSDPLGLAQGLGVLGFTHRLTGEDLVNTIHILEDAIEINKKLLYHLGTVVFLSELGRCHTSRGDFDRSIEALQHSRDVAREKQVSIPFVVNEIYLGFAEAYLGAAEKAQVPDMAAILKKAAKGCREALRHGKIFPGGMPEAMRFMGQLEWLRGNPDKARHWWELSLAKAEQLGMKYHRSRAKLELGRRFGDGEVLRIAEEELRSMGVQLS